MGATAVHETAIVSPKATLAEGVNVGAYAMVGPGVIVGEGTDIGPFVSLEHCTIGRNNRIFHGALLGFEPQDTGFGGELTRLTLCDNNVVREYATLHRASGEGEETRVGSHCYLMAHSHIAHNCQIGDEVIVANGVQMAGHVNVGEGAFISGNVVIHQFSRIGRLAMIGGLTRVNQDVPPFLTAVGGDIGVTGLNLVGLRRRGYTSSDLAPLKAAFETLYRSGLPMDKALEKLKDELGKRLEVQELVKFIEQSSRGVVKRLYREK